MAGYFFPQSIAWKSQPPLGVGPDLTHPLLRHPVFFHRPYGSVARDHIAGHGIYNANGYAIQTFGKGNALRLTQGSTQNFPFAGKAPFIPANTPFTLFCYTVYVLSGSSGNGRLMAFRGAGGGVPLLNMGVGSNGASGTGNRPSYLVWDDPSTLAHVDSGVDASFDLPALCVITRDSAGACTGYWDNTATAIGTVGGSFTFDSGFCAYGVDIANTGIDYWNGPVYYGGLVFNCWSARDVASVVENPWQLFEPMESPFFKAVAAAAAGSNHRVIGGWGGRVIAGA